MTSHSPPDSKRSLRFVPTLLGIAFAIVAIVVMLKSDLLDNVDFSHPDPLFLALLAASQLLYFTIMGAILAIFIKQLGIKLKFIEWFGITIAGLFIGNVAPIGGAAMVRVGYLRLKHDLPVSRFAALLAANIALNYSASGLIGLVILLAVMISQKVPIPLLGFGIMGIAMIGPIAALTLPVERLFRSGDSAIKRWLVSMMEGWHLLRKSPRVIVIQICLMVVLQCEQALSLLLGLFAIGETSTFQSMLFTSVMVNLARVTPIRDFFGLAELLAGAGSQIIGEDATLGISAALLLRLANWTIQLILGPILLIVLSRRLDQPLMTAFKAWGSQRTSKE